LNSLRKSVTYIKLYGEMATLRVSSGAADLLSQLAHQMIRILLLSESVYLILSISQKLSGGYWLPITSK
jgi:hypothetical protein